MTSQAVYTGISLQLQAISKEKIQTNHLLPIPIKGTWYDFVEWGYIYLNDNKVITQEIFV